METIARWLWEIGEAGQRLAGLGALEGAAGNISMLLPLNTPGLDALLTQQFPRSAAYTLPEGVTLPACAIIVTGTGRRLRDAARDPERVLCVLVVDAAGDCWLHRHADHGVRPTSEVDSHLGIYAAEFVGVASAAVPHAVVHAQPPHLTWLTHIPAYRDATHLNRQLLRWQPETVVMFPGGIGVLPFETPGTPAQGQQTAEALLTLRIVMWAKHGVVTHSAAGPLAASDLVEYAEAAARYEALDLQAGGPADGLTIAELRAVAQRFGAPPPPAFDQE